MEHEAKGVQNTTLRVGTILQFVEVVLATAGLVAAVANPGTWLTRKPDIRYEVLPTYTVQGMSVAGVQLFNCGRGIAKGLSVEIDAAEGTAVHEVGFAGDLSTQLAATSCSTAISSTVTCSISLMLGDTAGAIYVLLDSPDELVVRGVWGDPPVPIEQNEHRESSGPTLRVLRVLLFFLGLSTVIRAVGKMLLISLSKADKRQVPDQ
jgi:hypothetical protein